MTEWAAAGAVEEAMESWTEGQITCRLNGTHQYRDRTAFRYKTQRLIVVVQRCILCRSVERERDINEQGYALTRWRPRYIKKNYLLEGVGRVGMDGKAVLQLRKLSTMTIVEVEES